MHNWITGKFIVGETSQQTPEIIQKEPETTAQIVPPSLQLDAGPSVESIKKIPDWVKNIFGWYSQDKVSEDELLGAIKYLIDEGILVVD